MKNTELRKVTMPKNMSFVMFDKSMAFFLFIRRWFYALLDQVAIALPVDVANKLLHNKFLEIFSTV